MMAKATSPYLNKPLRSEAEYMEQRDIDAKIKAALAGGLPVRDNLNDEDVANEFFLTGQMISIIKQGDDGEMYQERILPSSYRKNNGI